MGLPAREIFDAALDLPETERLELASHLIASVDSARDPEWNSAWLDELDRREAAVADGGPPGAEWPESRRRVFAGFAQR
jgi:putative addiction module component (TIGR02574 family)